MLDAVPLVSEGPGQDTQSDRLSSDNSMYIVSIFIISLLIGSYGGQSSEEERERSEAEDKVDRALDQKHADMRALLKTPASPARDAEETRIANETMALMVERNQLKSERRKKRYESCPRNTVT